MRTDNRLPRVLHALLHLDGMDGPATSEQIGKMLGTNAAVVRRTMAGLRQAQLVSSAKGHGGGWFLTKPLDEISLLAVYQALGSPSLFAVGVGEAAPTCLMEQAANRATTKALGAAEALFAEELQAVSVADLANSFREYQASGGKEIQCG